MRLWSLHPEYLDRQGLLALWREALLAQAVLRGETRGYRHHPQLERFRRHAAPLAAIGAYLRAIHAEASARGYAFDPRKLGTPQDSASIPLSTGQLAFEWQHLLAKLAMRDPALYEKHRALAMPRCHPLFHLQPGGIEAWERAGTDDLPAPPA